MLVPLVRSPAKRTGAASARSPSDDTHQEVFLAHGPKAAVRKLGVRLGRSALPGDVIALVGDLGAGKTFLSQTIVHAAGVPLEVRVASPTFTIVQEYVGRLPIWHADFYRLGSVREADETGLFDRGSAGLVVVEWADRFPEAIPPDSLWLHIERVSSLQRRVVASGQGPTVERLMAAVAHAESAL